MGTNFWELLHQRQDQLTRSGHAVADYLLQHADEAQYLSISSLARECNVAEATVFRFCRALGFDGYHEMRIALAQANATGTPSSQRELQPGATTAELCEHAYARFLTAISGTQNALSTEAVDEAVHLMQEARQVFCLGQGGSMLLANDICARFASLSTKFRTAGDSHLQLLTASLMNEADVVLFVSYSGATRDMMETLRTAKAAGAKIILLTHYEDFLHCHVQHVGDGLFLIFDFQRLPVVTCTLADLAGDVDIRQEVHLDLEDTVALAGLAAASPDVKAEPARAIAPHLGVLCLRKDGADVVEDAGIGGRVGAGCPADGLLVDADDLIHKFEALYPIASACAGTCAVQLTGQRLIQDLIDEARFARAGDARHADKLSQRELHINIPQVVLPCPLTVRKLPLPMRRVWGTSMRLRPDR